jgi:hypothetical protein
MRQVTTLYSGHIASESLTLLVMIPLGRDKLLSTGFS